MNKRLIEKIILTESIRIKVFNDENTVNNMRLKLDDVISFGLNINGSKYVNLIKKGMFLVPLSTIKILRTQIPDKEKS